jgi:hypothetical protein
MPQIHGKFKNIMIRGFDTPQCFSAMEVLLKEIAPENCWYFVSAENYPGGRPPIEVPSGVKLHEVPIQPLLRNDFRQLVDFVRPLDKATIEKMSFHETITLRMAERMWIFPDIDHYRRRKAFFLAQLAGWKTFLEKEKIDLYLIDSVPHHPIDYIPYSLLREAGVLSYYFAKLPVPDSGFVATHWENAGMFIREHYDALKKAKIDPTGIQLSEVYERHMKMQTGQAGEKPRYAHIDLVMKEIHEERCFLPKLKRKASRLMIHLKALFSPEMIKFFDLDFWYQRKHSRERETKHLQAYYLSRCIAPDWNCNFVYFPLQYQPEGSTSPMCGAFNELLLMAKIISAAIPPDWKIYVKEYRGQTTLGRRTEFYDDLLMLPNVQLLDPEIASLDLIKKARAVATGTGTAAWEALFQQKTVLLFGHPSFQFAPGLHHISSLEDCQAAIAAEIAGVRPSLDDLKLYLSAAERLLIPCYNEAVFEGDSSLNRSQNGKNLATSLINALANSTVLFTR